MGQIRILRNAHQVNPIKPIKAKSTKPKDTYPQM
jgi:hypothetical protein